jgi:hypothetical protein
MLKVTEKTNEAIRYILDNLSSGEVELLSAEYGKDWKNFVEMQARDYDMILAVDDEDIPVLMCGVVPVENNIGVVWLLCTDYIARKGNYISFLRNARKQTQECACQDSAVKLSMRGAVKQHSAIAEQG